MAFGLGSVVSTRVGLPSPRTRPNPCWYGDDGIWAWGPVKIDAYVTITFSKLWAKIWLTDNVSLAREPTSGREQNATTQKVHVHVDDSEKRSLLCMSFVLDGSFLRCRSVLNQLFVAVNFANAWRWKPSCEGASKLPWPKSFRCWAIPDLFREVADLSAASFCLWRPEWWHTGIVKKKKTQALSLPPFLPLYKAIEYICSFHSSKKRKKKRTERGSSSSGKTAAFWNKPFGLHVVSSIQVSKTFFSFEERNVRATWRVFFSLHVTSPLWGCGTPSLGWGNFPSWRDVPFERTN